LAAAGEIEQQPKQHWRDRSCAKPGNRMDSEKYAAPPRVGGGKEPGIDSARIRCCHHVAVLAVMANTSGTAPYRGAGRPEAKKAIHLSPRDPHIGSQYHLIGTVHLLQSRTDEAIVWLEKGRSAMPAVQFQRSWLASAYCAEDRPSSRPVPISPPTTPARAPAREAASRSGANAGIIESWRG
jgi:hypothetical protein